MDEKAGVIRDEQGRFVPGLSGNPEEAFVIEIQGTLILGNRLISSQSKSLPNSLVLQASS